MPYFKVWHQYGYTMATVWVEYGYPLAAPWELLVITLPKEWFASTTLRSWQAPFLLAMTQSGRQVFRIHVY